MEISALFLTIICGFLGSAIMGAKLNWPDAGAIVAIAVMGSIILHKLNQTETNTNEDEQE